MRKLSWFLLALIVAPILVGCGDKVDENLDFNKGKANSESVKPREGRGEGR